MRIDRTDIRTSKLTTKRVKKLPARPTDARFDTAFKNQVADGHARFFERRGMPVPETSNYISFGGARK